MSPLAFILVIVVAFIAGVASVVDERQFHRPLVACTLMGFVLGDPGTGIIVGGTLELIALGWMNVGAAMAPDAALASTIAAVVVIHGHLDVAQGIAVAVPIAATGQVLTIFVRTITVFFQHQADRFAQTANFRGIELMHMSGMALQGLRVAIPTAVVSLINADTIKSWLDSIPGEITTGLRIAGGMITVVGFAMVINMMRSKALMPFFFLGFVVAAYTSFNLVALGVIGLVLAIVYVQLNPKYQQVTAAPAAAAASGADDDLDDELD